MERILIVTVGFLLDALFGDPHWLWHPVIGIGKVITETEKLLRRLFRLRDGREEDAQRKLAAGVLLVLITLFVSVSVPVILLWAAGRIHPLLRLLLECIMCYQLLAMRSLWTESMKVFGALKAGDVEGARQAVSMIVGRDTERLDEKGIIRAAVETVAENTSDGVIAPLLFLLLFGVPGGFFYKAVNTMDSMVGYRNERYLYLGRAAAKLDDLVNFIPARISAVFMIAAAFLLRMDGKGAARIFRRDRFRHASPNSAQTEAVCAGALSVRLAGDAWYFGVRHEKPYIGDAVREIEVEDIRRANLLMVVTAVLVLLSGILIVSGIMILSGGLTAG